MKIINKSRNSRQSNAKQTVPSKPINWNKCANELRNYGSIYDFPIAVLRDFDGIRDRYKKDLDWYIGIESEIVGFIPTEKFNDVIDAIESGSIPMNFCKKYDPVGAKLLTKIFGGDEEMNWFKFGPNLKYPCSDILSLKQFEGLCRDYPWLNLKLEKGPSDVRIGNSRQSNSDCKGLVEDAFIELSDKFNTTFDGKGGADEKSQDKYINEFIDKIANLVATEGLTKDEYMKIKESNPGWKWAYDSLWDEISNRVKGKNSRQSNTIINLVSVKNATLIFRFEGSDENGLLIFSNIKNLKLINDLRTLISDDIDLVGGHKLIISVIRAESDIDGTLVKLSNSSDVVVDGKIPEYVYYKGIKGI